MQDSLPELRILQFKPSVVQRLRKPGLQIKGRFKIQPQLTSSPMLPNCLINSSSRIVFTSVPCYSPLVQAHTIFDLNYCGSFLRSA